MSTHPIGPSGQPPGVPPKTAPRKPLAKRLFSGIAGSPLARVDEAQKPAQAPAAVAAEPEPAPVLAISAPTKRGRKPVFGIAMTAAERKALSRANQQAKQEDAEHRNLIAELMRIWKRQQGKNIIDPRKEKKRWEDAHKTASHHRRVYLDTLNQMSLDELKLVYGVENETPDSHGRLHNERSGEKSRSNGQSEIETILAAKAVTDTNLIDDEPDISRLKTLVALSSKVKPTGAAPASYDAVDSTADTAESIRNGSAKPVYEPSTNEKWRDKAIESLVSRMDFYSESEPQCPFCEQKFLVRLSAENHLQEQYGQGERDLETWLNHSSAMRLLSGTVAIDSRPRGTAYEHCAGIGNEMDLVKRLARKKPKRNFVTAGSRA